MQGRSNRTQSAAELSERRGEARALVNPPIYADIENANGALIYNMTEGGLAMSAAMVLRGEGPLPMRIQLGGDDDWIEATGQIVWKSGSGKTAGLRFIGLPEETRQIIRNWLARERSRAAPRPDGQLAPNRRQPSGDAAPTPAIPLPSPLTTPFTLVSSSGSIDLASGRLTDAATSTPFRERRAHPRHQTTPWSHVELGPENSGMLLNISESGLALIVAMRLANDELPAIRIQFADSKDSIEVNGEIVWLSESKREAGLRFVHLTAEASEKITRLISAHEVQVKTQEKIFGLSEARRAGEKKRRTLEPREGPPPSYLRKPESKFSQELSLHPITSPAGTKRYSGLPALLALIAVIALAAAGMAILPTVRTKMGGWSTPNRDKHNEDDHPLASDKAPETSDRQARGSDSRAQKFEPAPAESQHQELDKRIASASREVKSTGHPAAKPSVATAIGPPDGALPQNPAMGLPKSAAGTPLKQSAENPISQVMANSPSSPKVDVTPSRPNPATDVPSETVKAAMKDSESPPSIAKQPEASVTPRWAVLVHTDPYPSIRVPANMNSQKASPGKNLQIGRAISRVEPVYPEDAKRQGIEGVVRLHVTVGRDGGVKSIELSSGPDLLAKAATSAIHEWRYAQTVVGGQAVETEQDVVITFRLVSRPDTQN